MLNGVTVGDGNKSDTCLILCSYSDDCALVISTKHCKSVRLVDVRHAIYICLPSFVQCTHHRLIPSLPLIVPGVNS